MSLERGPEAGGAGGAEEAWMMSPSRSQFLGTEHSREVRVQGMWSRDRRRQGWG